MGLVIVVQNRVQRRCQSVAKLLLAIAAPKPKQPEFSVTLTMIPIGTDAKVTAAEAGQLLLRINETGAELDDNSGQLTVTITP